MHGASSKFEPFESFSHFNKVLPNNPRHVSRLKGSVKPVNYRLRQVRLFRICQLVLYIPTLTAYEVTTNAVVDAVVVNGTTSTTAATVAIKRHLFSSTRLAIGIRRARNP